MVVARARMYCMGRAAGCWLKHACVCVKPDHCAALGCFALSCNCCNSSFCWSVVVLECVILFSLWCQAAVTFSV